MGMTDKNLCDSCTNIGCMFQFGIVRTECAFYIPPHIEPDNCGKYVVMQPTVEAIPKAEVRKLLRDTAEKVSDSILDIVKEEYIPKSQYENRLKADMVAMLTEIQLEIDDLYFPQTYPEYMEGRSDCLEEVKEIIQQKIDKLKEENHVDKT